MNYKNEVIKFSIGFFMLIFIWSVFSFFINKSFLPGPFETIIYMVGNFFGKKIYIDFILSSKRILLALFFAFLVGFPIGIYAGVNKTVDKLISPLLYFLFPMPKIVFLPVFFVLFGINEFTRIFLIFFIIVFQVIVSVKDSVKNIDSEYIELFQTMGASSIDYLRIYIPFAMPGAFTSLRVSTGMAIAVLFITENFVADKGLGFIILNGMELRNYPEMYTGIILMGLLGYLFYFVTDFLERKVCFWQKSMLE